MNWHILTNLFFSGMILGSSVCALSCGWIFIPLVFEKNLNIKRSFIKFCLFHAGKILSYTVVGGLVGYSASYITAIKNSKIFLLVGGLFFFILGILNLFLPDKIMIHLKHNFTGCAGIIMGFVPCGALAGVLVYLAYVANTFASGAMAGFAFGLGNAINPLILLIFLAPKFPQWFNGIVKSQKICRIAGSLVFFFWAGTFFWKIS
ncbi:MAG: sulfite exporter TauE/SafE family protein [Candidatus Omnitrophica bacterium]|nr:sulfite exporter TauE/SafE family protein [Candidatus Omnitrophota bacterium]